jgi:signal transduction histidine kinase
VGVQVQTPDDARIGALYRLTAELAAAATLPDVTAAVVRAAMAVMDASAGSLALLTADGHAFEHIQWVGWGEETRATWARVPVALDTPMAAAARTLMPVLLGSHADWEQHFPAMAGAHRRGSTEATATLPIEIGGRAIGVLNLGFARVRPFADDDRAFMTTLALHAAQAVDRSQLYERERTARQEAEASGRMKDLFLATISHELRTPLNAILGWAEILRRDVLGDGAKRERALEAIVNNARRQSDLVDDLLDMARLAAGKMRLKLEPLPLARLLQSAVEAVRPAAEAKQIELHADCALDTTVRCDVTRIHQVLSNVLNNAVKFTPEGGRVELSCRAAAGAVSLVVRDSGAGMDAAFLPFVFDAFRQAGDEGRNRNGGLGLGLSIAHRIVALHGGTLTAHSDGPGHGATFTITLPCEAG